MDEYRKKLIERLEKVWEPPDFSKIFLSSKNRPLQTLRKGTILFNEGDPLGRLYYIKDGYVKIYRLSEEGRETTSYLLGPGHVLGVRTLLTQEERTMHTAEALTPLKVITISRKECFENIVEHPEVLVDLIHVFADRLAYTEKKYESFVYASTSARVAIFLADCAKRFGTDKNGEIKIDLDLTHQRIAEFVGAFRETVTIALHRLEKEGTVKVNRGNVKVLNQKKLNEYATLGRKR